MKKLILLFIIHCSLFVAIAQWFPQPSGTTQNLNSVCFIDSTHGWAVGDSGIILRYDGKQWLKQNSGITNSLTSVCFTDSLHGWAVGYRTILKYINKQWTIQDLSNKILGDSISFFSVSFSDTLHGSAAGFYTDYAMTQIQYILKYDGSKWIIVNHYFEGSHINSLHLIDSIKGWAVGSNIYPGGSVGTTLKYNGKDWIIHDRCNINLFSACFIDSIHGWAVGGFWDDNNGHSKNCILKFDGIQWTVQDSIHKQLLNSIYFLNELNGWAVGKSGAIVKFDGKIWGIQQSGTTIQLNSVYFTDSLNGWVVGQSGTILHTTNGGIITNIKNFSSNNYDIGVEIYPNPINESSVLTYQLPTRTSMNIKVYNFTGRELSTLMNATQDKGTYKIPLNPNNYKSGIYFIKLQTNNNINLTKFIKQ